MERAHEAFALGKELIDGGKRDVEIYIPSAASVVRSTAILDIYAAIVKPNGSWGTVTV
jgi:hypothetical protein